MSVFPSVHSHVSKVLVSMDQLQTAFSSSGAMDKAEQFNFFDI